MKLLRLPIDQISRFWPIISITVEKAMPPGIVATPNHGTRLLKLLLTGHMQAWAIARNCNDSTDVVGYMITQLMNEDITGLSSVLIYALAADDGIVPISTDEWKSLYEALGRYAKSNGATSVTAYTANERLIRIADGLGASTEYRFVVLEV